MNKIINPLFTTKHTYVEGGNKSDHDVTAFHDYAVKKVEDDSVLAEVHFQQGPVKECGVNGANNEDLLLMVIDRLERFQAGQFACEENALALTKLEEAAMWLRKRTLAREARGVEGTHTV